MCVKLPPKDLNSSPWPPHPTSTYTCGVTIALRVCGGWPSIFNITIVLGACDFNHCGSNVYSRFSNALIALHLLGHHDRKKSYENFI